MNLTGLTVFHPSFAMVYVEGAHKFVRDYKKLMLRRIGWTEAARARGEEDVELADGEAGPSTLKPAATPQQQVESITALEDNRCDLVWEGQVRERVFKNFRAKPCQTDALVKEALGPKLISYWDQAKNFKAEDEDLALAF
jgi:U4/U6 small nuclear ribonucleoprotein PRP3